jgi:hypothetical protein
MIRFVLKRDVIDVPVRQARRLIHELERSTWSPQMQASAAVKIRDAITGVPLLTRRVMFTLGEKVTLKETLRDVAHKTQSLPPALGELAKLLSEELDRARSGEAVRERDARRAVRRERERRRGFT